jgi:2-dehydropantoate 2-reductase
VTRIAILGPGGVGGFLAGALDRAGEDVTIVAREETAEALARDGLEVRSVRLGEFDARPRAVARLSDDVDVLVVATKSTGLEEALDRVIGEPGLVVPLLNGLDHLDLLRARYGPRAVAGTIRIEGTRVATGVIEQTSPFLRIDLASDHPAPRPRMAQFVDVLRAAEVPARLGDTEAQVLWDKLVRLNAIACTTSAWGVPLGEVRNHPRRRLLLEGAVEEAAAVAQSEGATIAVGTVMEEIYEAHAELVSSMARDIEAGRPNELDAIPGSVLRHAWRHGIECPTIEELVELVRKRIDGR